MSLCHEKESAKSICPPSRWETPRPSSDLSSNSSENTDLPDDPARAEGIALYSFPDSCRTTKGNGYELKLYGPVGLQQRALFIPRYLSRRAAAKDLEQLLHAHLLQLQAEIQLEEIETSRDTQELQEAMLRVWRQKANLEVQLLNRILQT
ncbi:uncharacterized protein LACBIDRAFT_334458 [Laccaria bicolor S238N-H82]|uniref:Predicted protein n=1 Tax=Laccaria bicolor (strain S238N-H82 / ATCC MYA-4686) TaxID=486041 RepID=B0DZ97_LACBS|nr:uncharacterized protein LACBIDRAFT_334458 [Laccaria bicolor S238N-H82]EDR00081.1 predicted protein [Laccaria bicolor S238N-H82]|eukprot:XP_001889287.1 predicted protein [Laccaria bicolor S238N-H82]